MAYFSNGTEGMVLDEQCSECNLQNTAPCPVLFVQMTYNYKQLKKGNELLQEAMNCLVDEDGNCKMKPEIDKLFDYQYGEVQDSVRKALDAM